MIHSFPYHNLIQRAEHYKTERDSLLYHNISKQKGASKSGIESFL